MLNEEIQIACPIHNQEIVLLDIQEGILLGERACCKECHIRKAYSITKAIQRINALRLQQTQFINNNIEQTLADITQIEKTIKEFWKEIEVGFLEMNKSLDNQKAILKGQLNGENEIKIKSLGDLQQLGQMIFELENNKLNQQSEINQEDNNLYQSNLHNQLDQIQNIVEKYLTTLKATKINQELQVFFRNNYQEIQSTFLERWVDPIIFLNDQLKAVLCDFAGVLELNFENNQCLVQRLIQMQNITGIYVGADLTWIVTAGQDARISIWQADNQNWKLSQQLQGHLHSINKMIINKTESQVISGGLDSKIVIWNKKGSKLEKHASLKQHEKSITSLAWSHSGTYFASGSSDQNLIVWKSNNGAWEIFQKISDKHQAMISDIIFDNYDNIYTAAENVKVWKQDNCQKYLLSSIVKTFNEVKKMLFVYDHQYLIILQKTIEIYKVMKNDIVHKQSIDDEYNSVAVSKDGQYMIAQKYKNQQLQLLKLQAM
ncbi:unnamed protein product (macronuclear) [Paramecium tetraurelia]|uniref:Uncharacterized protein n=1 Tax=Paramecium tetraurelia TaxID=5888 RepID=A0BM69_PARTE|nr:uncharacterized protein GSPATT00030270001 [Paramecium tetraurelia]CAK59636.1 unnamed protein product [Paramecium tetraurelia]|eukprot:XP_001427034.1 hypothetical protein (macronuclear) [Paramecium tetraurelia strain d4-2]